MWIVKIVTSALVGLMASTIFAAIPTFSASVSAPTMKHDTPAHTTKQTEQDTVVQSAKLPQIHDQNAQKTPISETQPERNAAQKPLVEAKDISVPYSTNVVTRSLLDRMGYSEKELWDRGIKIIPHEGAVPKRCEAGGNLYVSGLAVRSDITYIRCDDGEEVIFPKYRTSGKCTVIFDWTNYLLEVTQRGNAYAILAHEIGHCLHYTASQKPDVISALYAEKVRPELAGNSRHQIQEILADDFMICKMAADTSWNNNYYTQFELDRPDNAVCSRANVFFEDNLLR